MTDIENPSPVFILPFPPSVNALFGGGSKQKRFPSKQYKTWLSICPVLPKLMLTGVSLEYRFYFPDNRSRDAENYVKAVSDYLVKQGVVVDDSWQHIKLMTLRPMGVDKQNSRVEVEATIFEKTTNWPIHTSL